MDAISAELRGKLALLQQTHALPVELQLRIAFTGLNGACPFTCLLSPDPLVAEAALCAYGAAAMAFLVRTAMRQLADVGHARVIAWLGVRGFVTVDVNERFHALGMAVLRNDAVILAQLQVFGGVSAGDLTDDHRNGFMHLASGQSKADPAHVLIELHERFGCTAVHARGRNNFFLRVAASRNWVATLRVLRERYRLTPEDARDKQNGALLEAGRTGAVAAAVALRVLFDLGPEDACQAQLIDHMADHGDRAVRIVTKHFRVTMAHLRDSGAIARAFEYPSAIGPLYRQFPTLMEDVAQRVLHRFPWKKKTIAELVRLGIVRSELA